SYLPNLSVISAAERRSSARRAGGRRGRPRGELRRLPRSTFVSSPRREHKAGRQEEQKGRGEPRNVTAQKMQNASGETRTARAECDTRSLGRKRRRSGPGEDDHLRLRRSQRQTQFSGRRRPGRGFLGEAAMDQRRERGRQVGIDSAEPIGLLR